MSKRVPVIAGNWKMNTTLAEGKSLASEIARGVSGTEGVEVVLCPPFPGLATVTDSVSDSGVFVGAQNVSSEQDGAFTGEVSARMLQGLASHVIIGHSERRSLYCETDESIASKAIAAHSAGLTPIVCVGENLDVRQSGEAVTYVRRQLRSSLTGFDGWESLIVAYEPVWAIGTGEAASPQQAQEIISGLRDELSDLANQDVASEVRILYGGSVNATNIGPFLDRPDIDGALVGGASLKAEEFARIIEVTARLYQA